MDDAKVTSIKRYINNKFNVFNQSLKAIEKKMNTQNNAVMKLYQMNDSLEKKLKTQTIYMYKMMKTLDLLISDDKVVPLNVNVPPVEEVVLPEVVVKKTTKISPSKPKPKKPQVVITSGGSMRELKKESLQVDESVVKKYLNTCDITSDISLFKHIYLENGECPIRYINKNNFQYWADNMWNDDIGGEHIVNVVVSNISKLYIRTNTYDNYGSSIDKYQLYIYKMGEKKYRELFLKKMKNLIKI